MSIPFLEGFRLPGTFKLYDDTIDPNILKKSALLWFSILKPNSIHEFSKLGTRFLTHFSTSQAHHKTSVSLINLKQEENESLRAFKNRFNQEVIQVKDLNPVISMHAIMAGLKPAFGYINIKKVSTTQHHSYQQLALLWLSQQMCLPIEHQHRSDRDLARKRANWDQAKRERVQGYAPEPPRVQYDMYTLLTTKKERIFQEVYNSWIIPLPEARGQHNPGPNVDVSKRYYYHRIFGHSSITPLSYQALRSYSQAFRIST